MQERFWFIDRLELGRAVYNISVAWRPARRAFDLSTSALFRAALLLLATCPVLRSKYGGSRVDPDEMVPLPARMSESTVA